MARKTGNKERGKVGDKIYYTWHGRQCERSMPKSVSNPQTEAQQAHRKAFVQVARLSSDLTVAHSIGFDQAAKRMQLNTYSVFRKVNKDCCGPEGIDYSKVVLSRGSANMIYVSSLHWENRKRLVVAFDNIQCEGATDDHVFLFAYFPEQRKCLTAKPVKRSAGSISISIPTDWQRTPYHLYAFARTGQGITSDTVYITPIERVAQ